MWDGSVYWGMKFAQYFGDGKKQQEENIIMSSLEGP